MGWTSATNRARAPPWAASWANTPDGQLAPGSPKQEASAISRRLNRPIERRAGGRLGCRFQAPGRRPGCNGDTADVQHANAPATLRACRSHHQQGRNGVASSRWAGPTCASGLTTGASDDGLRPCPLGGDSHRRIGVTSRIFGGLCPKISGRVLGAFLSERGTRADH